MYAPIKGTRLFTVTFTATCLAVLVTGCEPDLPPGFGDRIPNADFEVVDGGGSGLAIGQRLDLASLEGKPIILDFWASWCGPCKRQHVYVQELKAQYGDAIEVVGILYQDDPANARLWLRKNGASYPTVLEPSSTLEKEFWISGIPRFVLLTPERTLSWDMLGGGGWSGADSVAVRLEAMVGKPGPGGPKATTEPGT
jgi:cytochrome c biogenesis protein CcmG/thiol:disulfide interchange protein DsbE